MPLYRASAARLRSEIESETLVPTLTEQFRHRLGYSPAPGEVRSWERSLQVLSADLVEAGLDQVEALVEYQLPLTSKRADVVLCGSHPRTGAPSYVIVELKQWTRALMLDGADDVCVLEGMGERLHPVEQVRRYCSHLLDFAATLEEIPESLSGVAYLHNATDQDIAGLWDLQPGEHGRLFTGQRRGEFLQYLTGRLVGRGGADAADRLLGTAVRPSKQLLALAAEEVQHREQFVLLDEQQTAYSLVMRAVDKARSANSKEVIIVSGGPGSGKSVIALSLMSELSRQGRSVLHATGSKAFTQTLRKVAGSRQPRVRGMFKYFNQFIDAELNGIDVLFSTRPTGSGRPRRTATRRHRFGPDGHRSRS